MVTIIKIIKQKKLIRIELDDGEAILLQPDLVPIDLLYEGSTLTDIHYRQLKEESLRYECREKALFYLAIKRCTEHQLVQYLKKKGFSEYIIQEIVRQMVESRYVDDYSYSIDYIHSRKKKKSLGKQMLIRELAGKGVSRQIINRAIREAGAEKDTIEEVYEVARKKYKKLKESPSRLAKVGFFLRQRGFNSDTINKALQILSKEGGDEWDDTH